jgi:hypothetical protein
MVLDGDQIRLTWHTHKKSKNIFAQKQNKTKECYYSLIYYFGGRQATQNKWETWLPKVTFRNPGFPCGFLSCLKLLKSFPLTTCSNLAHKHCDFAQSSGKGKERRIHLTIKTRLGSHMHHFLSYPIVKDSALHI